MDRVKTGIPGLDNLLGGGLPKGSLTLLSGPSGSLKTIIAGQYIHNGITQYNEPGIYVTLEERSDGIRKSLSSFGMDFNRLVEDGKLIMLDLGDIRKKYVFQTDKYNSVFTSSILIKALAEATKNMKPARLVIDSLSIIGVLYDNPAAMREDLFKLIEYIRDLTATAMLITEVEERYKDTMVSRFGSEEFLSDGVILLGYTRAKGEFKRWLSVRKMRFTNHDSDLHPLRLTENGVEVVATEKLY